MLVVGVGEWVWVGVINWVDFYVIEAGDNGVNSPDIDRRNNPNVSQTQGGDNVSPSEQLKSAFWSNFICTKTQRWWNLSD